MEHAAGKILANRIEYGVIPCADPGRCFDGSRDCILSMGRFFKIGIIIPYPVSGQFLSHDKNTDQPPREGRLVRQLLSNLSKRGITEAVDNRVDLAMVFAVRAVLIGISIVPGNIVSREEGIDVVSGIL